jgi:hypothetical protein
MRKAITWMRAKSDRLIVLPVFPEKTRARSKMREIATFVRSQSGDLTISGKNPGKTRLRTLVALVALGLLAPARAGDRPIANLFPADTLAYAEATDFVHLAPVLASWVKGTTLAGGVSAQHDRRDSIRDHKQVPQQADLAKLGILAAPEFHADLARLKGVAVAFTGFNDKHEPRLVLAVLLGDSTALSLYARQLVTADPDVRRVDSVEGVPVCQYRPFGGPGYGPDGNVLPLNASKPPVGPFEPTYAFTPGLFVLGSDAAAVKDVIKRYLGKEPAPSLLSVEAFRKIERPKGDVVLFARPAEIVAALDTANKATETHDPDWLAVVKLAVNSNAVPVVSGAIHLKPDGWALELSTVVASGEKSPLLDLLGGVPGLTATDLPAGTGLIGSLTFPPVAKRVAAVFDTADALAKAVGCLGPLPGERYAGEPNVRTLLGTVHGVRTEWPAKEKSKPVIVLECDSAAAAAAWVAAAPLLVQKTLRSTAPTAPVSEPAGGVTVHALTTGDSGLGTLFYAAKGPLAAAGFDRAAVLTALNRDAKPGSPATASLTVTPLALYDWLGPPAPPPFPALGVAAVTGTMPQALPTAPPVTVKDVLAPLPPMSASVLRENGKLTVRVEQTKWDAVRVSVIDAGVTWYDRYLAEVRQPQNMFLPRGLWLDR